MKQWSKSKRDIQTHSCLSLSYILESQNHKLCILEHSSLGNLCWQNSCSAFKVATVYGLFTYDEWMNWGLVLKQQSQGCGKNLNHVSSWLIVFKFMSKCADECSFIRLLHFSKYFSLQQYLNWLTILVAFFSAFIHIYVKQKCISSQDAIQSHSVTQGMPTCLSVHPFVPFLSYFTIWLWGFIHPHLDTLNTREL